MQRSGFTTIEMVIVVVLIGLIAMIGFPKISKMLDKTNVRSARDAVGTLAATARAAAIQRGCRSALHFTASPSTVWVTTACPAKLDTVSGVQNFTTRFKVTLAASRDSVQYDPRGLSMDGFNSNTVVRLTGSVATNKDSVMINPIGKVVRQ
ncbi:MAG TPA: prepilin-type N-terminal cleavage/methylation domain-containing protein [Gemmatimonadales bacterium]|jgi:prepilin-type N-terminal cleavage/methylation domain-containing protein|nr:prepilin-type N-terminal cleavage/methylation domain-containing protein [Gemmatimonadales bacterium]